MSIIIQLLIFVIMLQNCCLNKKSKKYKRMEIRSSNERHRRKTFRDFEE